MSDESNENSECEYGDIFTLIYDETKENPEENTEIFDIDSTSEVDVIVKNVRKKGLDYKTITETLNTPTYEDVTLMINSNVPFLIEADALLMYSFMQDNHECKLGGQFLHAIYYCERFLNMLLEKGGNFIIVFFDIWKNFWEKNPYIKCLRLSLFNHMKINTVYRIHCFSSFHCEDFRKFIDIEKPRCILLDLSYHLQLQKFNTHVSLQSTSTLLANTNIALSINCTEIIFFRANDLPCIDICEINIDESTIYSFNLHSNVQFITLNEILCKKLDCTVQYPASTCINLTKCDYSEYDIRRAAVIITSHNFLSIVTDQRILKLLILCYAAQEVLKLEHRCCPIIEFGSDQLNKIQNIVIKWLDCLSISLETLSTTLKWDNIADVWQGTLFSYICYVVNNIIIDGSELGHFQEAYEQYIELIQSECNMKIEAYPIRPLFETKKGVVKILPLEKGSFNLYRLNNPLIRSFCDDVCHGVQWRNAPESLRFDEFDEIKHWHCRKPMTDDYEHIKDSLVWVGTTNTKEELRKKQKAVGRYTHFLNTYGRNLEGNNIKAEVIICGSSDDTETKDNIKKTKKDKNKNDKTKKKEGKKAAQLKEQNKNKKDQEILSKEQAIINNLKTSKYYNTSDIDDKLNEIDKILKRTTMKETIFLAKLLKLKTYRDYFKSIKPEDVNDDYVKDVFLIIRSVLQTGNDLSEKDKGLLSKLLHQLGFAEIAKRNNLPTDVKYNVVLQHNWISYQLKYLGPEMERLSGGKYDDDLGFTPDPWQSEFIGAIRKKQSALVVAPTSSGKTFAAYYCMKRVLQESRDGVVVYVAPTKALVNQVEATVYARFKNVESPPGKAIVGVFTRDYRTNTLNSRILVTDPQCLDILLLSPRRYTWFKNVKYVIFDEVHKLFANIEGLVWERCLLLIRCPFLALSATISDVRSFHNWLQANENFKKEQDQLHNRMRRSYEVVLVEHSERHSDLIKYVYNNKTNFQHYHPYCALDSKTLRVHNGVPATIQLSPCEVLQLYNAMRANNWTRHKLTNKLDIFNFFSNEASDGYIKRNDVRKYEQLIAKAFYEIHSEEESVSLDIIKHLLPSAANEISGVTEIPELLNCMHERNMLPCIVFSYNRNVIESANHLVVKQEIKNNEPKTDRRTEKQNDKSAKKEKKLREKEEGSNKGDQQQLVKPSYILRETRSKFKGEGIADSQDMVFIERRLRYAQGHKLLRASFPYGVAYHHAGLDNKLRSTVEILFRMGIVRVVFATGTLALGIHMPCKSVVVFGDSPFLNSIEYHQMSGRAGRRGFDTEGNVIFMGLTKKRQDMLMTDKLPRMLGNFPISVTLVARLLLLTTKVTDKGKVSDEVTNITNSRVLALLENSLIFQFKPNLKLQIKYFVEFAAQLLFIQGIYSGEGIPLKLAGVVTHLHYHEPANLVFAYLLRTGAFRRLISSMKSAVDIEWSLLIVISHLFARLKLHKLERNLNFNNSIVILEPLPDIILKAINNYNRDVKFVFDEYFISVAKHLAHNLGEDNTLPASNVKFVPMFTYAEDEDQNTLSAKIKSACYKRVACSSFIALSGIDDTSLYTGTMINNIRHEICPGLKLVPLIDTTAVYNSYAADFYRHGIISAIRKDNGLRQGNEFTLLKDFLLVLKTIVVSLEELEPVDENDSVYKYFKKISTVFDEKFSKAKF